MAKSLFIAEKPSVAQEFAKALHETMRRGDGYQESDSYVVTWCVGHLVTMSYPDAYDPKYKRWSLETLPFLPDEFLYEVIPSVRKQFTIVSHLLNRSDVDTIYVCTDSGREGEYIYRLVEQEAKVQGKKRRRVWIDSQTEEEIHRGIEQAKDLSEYDNLASAAYLRAKEDYLMGINFSRLLTLKYGNAISSYLGKPRAVVSVGRVMTCVLGMVVRREREIRKFVKTPFYRVVQMVELPGGGQGQGSGIEGEFRAVEGSDWYLSPKLYKENGFRERADAGKLIGSLMPASAAAAVTAGGGQTLSGYGNSEPASVNPAAGGQTQEAAAQRGSWSGDTLCAVAGETARIDSLEKKKEKKNPPLLYNLAELQNECSRMFKISPDETLRIVQELYEKKLVTYPRTDARVLSTAVAKEIYKNISGLKRFEPAAQFAEEILTTGSYKEIARTRYVNDKQITDHYAIIPTGQGLNALGSLKGHAYGVYAAIVRRFLSIFYPAAEFQKVSMVTVMGKEKFFFSFKVLLSEGYFKVAGNPNERRAKAQNRGTAQGSLKNGSGGNPDSPGEGTENGADGPETEFGTDLLEALKGLRKGMQLQVRSLGIREGETSPPKRYNSGSMILAMENAGQLIEDEELRAQIKGSGIGTSATRAEILKKLVANEYIALNKKTQILTPTLQGEMIHDVVYCSIRSLLNPELTASWEKGLTYVAEGSITSEEYMEKLEHFIRSRTEGVLALNNQLAMRPLFDEAAQYYAKKGTSHNTPESGDSVVDLSGKNPQARFSSDKSYYGKQSTPVGAKRTSANARRPSNQSYHKNGRTSDSNTDKDKASVRRGGAGRQKK
ncbi:MAG: DNA topoisomerase [Lachnospiraceae bacterium]|nr:DNA topoisomerase [Lachnospiraceae bacterium]